MTRLVNEPDPTYIRSGAKAPVPTSRVRRIWAQEDDTILNRGFLGHVLGRFVYQGSTRTGQSWKMT